MKFKIKKTLNDRQLYRAKFSVAMAALVLSVQYCSTYFVNGAPDSYTEKDGVYTFEDREYKT